MKRSARSLVAVAAIACSHYVPTCLGDATTSAQNSHPSDATCPTQSVNYVTHTLPQQCLRTSWSASSDQHNASSTQDVSQASLFTSTPVETIVVSLAPDVAAAAASFADEAASSSADIQTSSADVMSSTNAASDAAAAPSASSGPSEGDEPDSFLDAAKFLSFEDWKKQKIGEAGDSADALTRSRGDARHRPGEGFDTLGEESEINLDFGGFGSAMRPVPSASHDDRPSDGSRPTEDATPSPGLPRVRSKDAGRTCKERFNYGSFDCAASVLKTNPKCKSPTSVLVENKDSYMLNECSTDNKFLIVELCEYVEIDTVVLANFEFFSSMFRTFRVSVSDRYPVKLDKWQVLGTYEARNTREIQAFLVENPVLWAKFLRIEFLTHYGSEFYCPLSLLRVHGTNMMEDYRRQEELAQGVIDAPEEVEVVDAAVVSIKPETEQVPAQADPFVLQDRNETPGLHDNSTLAQAASVSCLPETVMWPPLLEMSICPASDPPASNGEIHGGAAPTQPKFAFTQDSSHSPSITTSSNSPVAVSSISSSAPTTTPEPASNNVEVSTTLQSSTVEPPSSPSVPSTDPPKVSSVSAASTSSLSSSVTTRSASPDTAVHSSPVQSSAKPDSSASSTLAIASYPSSSQSSSASGSILPPVQQSPSPHPPTQESIFKSITKRLALLEANATLSLQYIESQSSLLRSAFAATNSQQLNKTANFLAQLNATVLTELARAKADYDQLWQSTVLELHGQREDSRKERELLGERVRLLADEIVGTKRLMAAQATLLLVVLGLVLFTRNASVAPGSGASVDLRFLSAVQGLVRHGRSRSGAQDAGARGRSGPRSRWHWDAVSPWHSPPQTRPSTSASADDDAPHASSPAPSLAPRDKPLPPAPGGARLDPADEPDSDAAPERRDTLTQRDFRPALRIYDPGPRDALYEASPLSAGTDSSDDVDVDDGSARAHRGGALRDVRSAPTTPGVSGAPSSGILDSPLARDDDAADSDSSSSGGGDDRRNSP